MRGFLVGALVGIALGVAGLLVVQGEQGPGGPAPAPASMGAAEVEPTAQPEAELMVSAGLEGRPASGDRTAGPGAPFEPGTTVLRVGDAFTFGATSAMRLDSDTAEESVDIVCQDIRHGGSLRTPHGAARVPTPFSLKREPVDVQWVFDRLEDGPEHYPERNVHIAAHGDDHFSGVALIQAADGAIYKVRLLETHGDPRVWMRWIRIAYQRVDSKKAGGGVVSVPGQPRLLPLENALPEAVEALLEAPRLPSDSFRNFLRGRYQRIADLPEQLDLEKRTYITLDKPLATAITFNRYSGVVARAGVAQTGRLTIKSYTGVLVAGDMEGTVDVESYAYVHVRGDVTGTINCNSYATVIVEGDVRGTINIGSYVTLRVKGRFVRPESLSCKGSCWSTFFFDQYHSEAELMGMPASRQVTLHVRSSDLPVGKHKIAPWREVIVGDALWEKLE